MIKKDNVINLYTSIKEINKDDLSTLVIEVCDKDYIKSIVKDDDVSIFINPNSYHFKLDKSKIK